MDAEITEVNLDIEWVVNDGDFDNESASERIEISNSEGNGVQDNTIPIEEDGNNVLPVRNDIEMEADCLTEAVNQFWTKHDDSCQPRCRHNCTAEFSKDEVMRMMMDSKSLDEWIDGVNRLNLTLLAIIRIILRRKRSTKHTSSDRHSLSYGTRHPHYMVEGVEVCRNFFLFVHNIGEKRWKNLLRTYQKEGVIEKKHGHCQQKPHNRTPFESSKAVVQFLRNYAEENGLRLPGRQANQKQIVKILPSGCRKTDIYKRYVDACATGERESVSEQIFLRIWRECCNDIVLQKPRAKIRAMNDDEKEKFFR